MSPSGRPPEPFASSAVTSSALSRCLCFGPCNARPLCFDHPSTPSRLLLEVPSVGSPFRPSTPGDAPKRSPSAPSCQRGSLVPPAWFLSTSTYYSGLTARALLRLAADPGVHRVSLLPGHLPCRSRKSGRSAWSTQFPTMHSPREDSLHQQRLPSLTAPSEDGAYTRGRSLHAVLTGGTAVALSAQRLRASHWRLLPSCSTPRFRSAGGSVAAVRCFQPPTVPSFHGLLSSLRPPNPHPTRMAPDESGAARSS
jgi:hypothetical protein